MNQICIAKKVSHQNTEFLDFAVNDDDKLIVFSTFKEASEFLKREVGTGEELLNFIVTTVEAQKDNLRMQEILANGTTQDNTEQATVPIVDQAPQDITPPPIPRSTEVELSDNAEEVEVYFMMRCSDFEIVGTDSVIDKRTGKQLVPILGFVDIANVQELVQVPNFELKQAFIGKVVLPEEEKI